MVSALDAFVSEHRAPKRGPVCHVCALFSTSEEIAQTVRGGRTRPVPVPYKSIAAFLQSRGHRVSDYQLRDHFLRHEVSR